MLTLKEVGARIKDLRIKANQSQEYVAEQLNTSQNIISRMEKGDGGSLVMFLSVITYYRGLYNMDNFLAEDFNVSDIKSKNMSGMESLAIENLKLFKEETVSHIDRVISLLEKP